jgi:hypothetical protein
MTRAQRCLGHSIARIWSDGSVCKKRITQGRKPSCLSGCGCWFWWTKRHWGGSSPTASVSPVNSHSVNCHTFINHHIIPRYIILILAGSLNNKQMTDSLTEWSKVIFKKKIVDHLVKRFLTVDGTQRFISVFTKAHTIQSRLGPHESSDTTY